MVGLSSISSKLFNIINFKTPQNAILGVLDLASNDSIFKNNKVFINHIVLIFKLSVYKSREKQLLNINYLRAEIRKVKE